MHQQQKNYIATAHCDIQNKNLTFMNVIKKEWKVNNIVKYVCGYENFHLFSMKI